MHADGSENIRISGSQDNGHRGSCRDSRDIDAVGINGPAGGLLYKSLDNSDDTGRFTPSALLMRGGKPVPTPVPVLFRSLPRVDNDETMLLRQLIHLCACGEVLG